MPALAYRTKLPRPDDPDILARVHAAIVAGHPIQTAARIAGIGHTSAWDWNRQGLQLLDAHPNIDPRELGSTAVFADMVKQAEAEFVDRHLGAVNAAVDEGGPKAWIPAMTLLERRRPQDFGRYSREPQQAPTTQVLIVTPDTAGALAGYQAQRLLMSPSPEATE